jgi:hypothetical protein
MKECVVQAILVVAGKTTRRETTDGDAPRRYKSEHRTCLVYKASLLECPVGIAEQVLCDLKDGDKERKESREASWT